MTVVFVESTKGGELASRMKELVRRLAPIIGFGMKVVEKAGSPLKNSFPLNNLWEGAMCGRPECIPCTQGAEQLPPCTQPSLVHENVCSICNAQMNTAVLFKVHMDMAHPMPIEERLRRFFSLACKKEN